MGKTIYGYSPSKLKEKADKRKISIEAYVSYLREKNRRK